MDAETTPVATPAKASPRDGQTTPGRRKSPAPRSFRELQGTRPRFSLYHDLAHIHIHDDAATVGSPRPAVERTASPIADKVRLLLCDATLILSRSQTSGHDDSDPRGARGVTWQPAPKVGQDPKRIPNS